MSKKRHKSAKRRGSSNAGRPRQAGKRHPSGKLVQKIEPNERVMAERQALVSGLEKVDLSAAEDPMALAYAHGWLTEVEHKAGEAYARYYAASHVRHRSTGGLSESPDPSQRDMRSIGQMSDAEIVHAFDHILDSTRAPAASEDREMKARARYNALSAAMTPAEQTQVFQCFCLRSWPQWLIYMASGKTAPESWDRKRKLLIRGLDIIAAQLTKPRKQSNSYRNYTGAVV